MFKQLTQVFNEHLDDVLLLCRIQEEKLNDKQPLFLENCTQSELIVEKEKYLKKEQEYFNTYFLENPEIHNKIIANYNADNIRYGFIAYCIFNNISKITYDIFLEFSKMYNIPEDLIIIYVFDDNEIDRTLTIEQLKEKHKNYITEINTFKYIAEQTTFLALDQYPRQFKDYIKFYNKDNQEIKAPLSEYKKFTPYEERVIEQIFKKY